MNTDENLHSCHSSNSYHSNNPITGKITGSKLDEVKESECERKSEKVN